MSWKLNFRSGSKYRQNGKWKKCIGHEEKDCTGIIQERCFWRDQFRLYQDLMHHPFGVENSFMQICELENCSKGITIIKKEISQFFGSCDEVVSHWNC